MSDSYDKMRADMDRILEKQRTAVEVERDNFKAEVERLRFALTAIEDLRVPEGGTTEMRDGARALLTAAHALAAAGLGVGARVR